MWSQLGAKKVRSISEILKEEPPTFSGISIMDNEEIFPFLAPLAPKRIRKRSRPSSESPEKSCKKIKQGLSAIPSEEKDQSVDTGSIRMHIRLMKRSFDKVQKCLQTARKEQERIFFSMKEICLFLGLAVARLKSVQYGVNRFTP